jgi:hypothetical protein
MHDSKATPVIILPVFRPYGLQVESPLLQGLQGMKIKTKGHKCIK